MSTQRSSATAQGTRRSVGSVLDKVAAPSTPFHGLLARDLQGSPNSSLRIQQGAAEVRKQYHEQVAGSMRRCEQDRVRRPKTVLGLAGMGLKGLMTRPRCRVSLSGTGEVVIPSPRETNAKRLLRVKTACSKVATPDSWNKAEITATAELWNSHSLRGFAGGCDLMPDNKSFYSAIKNYKAGRVKKAIQTLEQIRMGMMVRGNGKAVAKPMSIVCGYLGDAYHRLAGTFTEAVEYHISSLKFGEEIRYQCGKDCATSESHVQAIAALPAVGQAQMPPTGTTKRTAIEYHRQQLEFARYCKDKVGEQAAAKGLGHSQRWFDGHMTQLTKWEEQLKYAQRLGDFQTECKLLESIGQTYLTEGQQKKAISYFQTALKSAKMHGDVPLQAQAHSSLGCAYRSMDNMMKAIDHHESAVSCMTQENDRSGLARTYLELAMDYHALLPQKYTFGIGKLGSKEKSVVSLPWNDDHGA